MGGSAGCVAINEFSLFVEQVGLITFCEYSLGCVQHEVFFFVSLGRGRENASF